MSEEKVDPATARMFKNAMAHAMNGSRPLNALQNSAAMLQWRTDIAWLAHVVDCAMGEASARQFEHDCFRPPSSDNAK